MKKRFLVLVLVLMFGFFLASCGDDEPTDPTVDPTVADTVNPQILGVTNVTITLGDSFNALTGVTATDNIDGNLTSSIVVTGTYNVNVAGVYTITYTVTDAAGNVATATRILTVTQPVVPTVDPTVDPTPVVDPTVDPTVPPLTSITFAGISDLTVAYESVFDVLEGVTAMGNDGLDYTSSITYISLSTITGGLLDTTKIQIHAIRYEVRIGTVLAQRWRYITVEAPERPDDQLVVNGDFATNTSFWDDPANGLYIADGAALTISHDEGMLKAEIVAGSNVWTPRFGQQMIPFEQGKTYEVSFKAMSTVPKTINLQVGELISTAPWFVDFKPGQTEHILIGTEMATYSFKFNMTLDNPRGGILFELGNVGGMINATMWFDDIQAVESTPDEDVTGPVLSGVVSSVNVAVNSVYNPLAGVTAFDLTDGDVTNQIVVTVVDSEGLPVDAVDTSVEGIFTVTYTVVDSLGNETVAMTVVSVVGLVFSNTNLVANPSFANALNVDKPEWQLWTQDWGAAPVVDLTHDVTEGTLALDITGGGDAVWSIQLYQDGYITLEEGKTYRLSFTASATVARSVSIALGHGSWVEYARKNGIEVGVVEATYDFIFTVTKETHAVKLVFELGAQAGFADGIITFSHVALNELAMDPIVTNSNFNFVGWRAFANDWEGTSITSGIVNGEFRITLNNYNVAGENWKLQLIQDEISMGFSGSDMGVIELLPSTAYTFSFDAYASEAITITPMIATPGIWANFNTVGNVPITTEKATYTVSVMTPATLLGTEVLKFEFGNGFAPFTAEQGPKFIAFDNIKVLNAESQPVATVFNGDFETVLFHSYDNAGQGVGSMKMVADGALIVVETVGGEPYTPHYYYMIDELAAGDYQVVLRMTSSVARDLRLNLVLPNAGWSSVLPGGFYDFAVTADEMIEVVLTFTLAQTTTNIKLELDFGTLGGEKVSLPGEFTLHQLLVYPKF
jgi:hypothetical protein